MGRKRIRDNEFQVYGMGSQSSAGPRTPSSLVTSLLKNYFSGDISASALREICNSAQQDGASHPDIAKLAKLGTEGAYSGHIARDLEGCLQPSSLSDALVRMPLKTKMGNKLVETIHRVVLPHKLFAAMWSTGQNEFQEFWCGGDTQNLINFWRALPTHLRPRADLMDKTVPLKFFGDGVAVLGINKSWGKSVQSYLLTPLVTNASGKARHILLNILWKDRLAPEAFKKWWKILAWSLEALLAGVWPHTDANGAVFPDGSESALKAGTPLAGNFRGRVTALTGDLEFLHLGYCLNSPNSLMPCSKCKANSAEVPWTDSRLFVGVLSPECFGQQISPFVGWPWLPFVGQKSKPKSVPTQCCMQTSL